MENAKRRWENESKALEKGRTNWNEKVTSSGEINMFEKISLTSFSKMSCPGYQNIKKYIAFRLTAKKEETEKSMKHTRKAQEIKPWTRKRNSSW